MVFQGKDLRPGMKLKSSLNFDTTIEKIHEQPSGSRWLVVRGAPSAIFKIVQQDEPVQLHGIIA